ncbi:MAG: peroxiredoxin family protein [Nocardioides sp.]|nr:peroxiredoxin family protein [Nocardioides sp.]
MSHKAADRSRAERAQAAAAENVRQRRRHQLRWGVMITIAAVLVAVVSAMMLTSRPTTSEATRTAPDFSLTDTAGVTHTLADHRGENVVLYFSEGAGCQSCIVQMGELEKTSELAEANVTVLPIVMNTRDQILRDTEANGVTTPFLLDDGTVSKAYGTLGNGMHAGLPGHSFVLIDAEGRQRWYGEYPSMWLDPAELLTEIRDQLDA